MQDNNYTNYSQMAMPQAADDAELKQDIETIEAAATNALDEMGPELMPTPQEPDPEPVTAEVPVKKGIVVNCDKLNVRKAPTKGSEAIAKITKGNEVIINDAESKGGFYKISTVSGIEGYCMKAYIEVK